MLNCRNKLFVALALATLVWACEGRKQESDDGTFTPIPQAAKAGDSANNGGNSNGYPDNGQAPNPSDGAPTDNETVTDGNGGSTIPPVLDDNPNDSDTADSETADSEADQDGATTFELNWDGQTFRGNTPFNLAPVN